MCKVVHHEALREMVLGREVTVALWHLAVVLKGRVSVSILEAGEVDTRGLIVKV